MQGTELLDPRLTKTPKVPRFIPSTSPPPGGGLQEEMRESKVFMSLLCQTEGWCQRIPQGIGVPHTTKVQNPKQLGDPIIFCPSPPPSLQGPCWPSWLTHEDVRKQSLREPLPEHPVTTRPRPELTSPSSLSETAQQQPFLSSSLLPKQPVAAGRAGLHFHGVAEGEAMEVGHPGGSGGKLDGENFRTA